MKVLVFGQQRWGGFLARQMNRYGTSWGVSAEYRNIAAPKFQVPWVSTVRKAEVIVRVGYPVGAPTVRGRAFDLFWDMLHAVNPSALYLHYWIGTDVQSVTRYHAGGRLRTGVFEKYRGEMHATLTARLADELLQLSVEAAELPFDGLDLPPIDERQLALPRQFTVLTYIPDERWSFYGGEQLVRAARQLPRVRFLVTAGRGNWLRDRPANITFLGWRNDMEDLYAASSVVLRLVEHDALGSTVVEGLAMARYVIYNYPVPFTETVGFDDIEGIVHAVGRLVELHDAGLLRLNVEGRHWALAAYDEERLIARLCESLAAQLGERDVRRGPPSARC